MQTFRSHIKFFDLPPLVLYGRAPDQGTLQCSWQRQGCYNLLCMFEACTKLLCCIGCGARVL